MTPNVAAACDPVALPCARDGCLNLHVPLRKGTLYCSRACCIRVAHIREHERRFARKIAGSPPVIFFLNEQHTTYTTRAAIQAAINKRKRLA